MLGIVAPWTVDRAEISPTERRVDLWTGYPLRGTRAVARGLRAQLPVTPRFPGVDETAIGHGHQPDATIGYPLEEGGVDGVGGIDRSGLYELEKVECPNREIDGSRYVTGPRGSSFERGGVPVD
ncbi:MAG: hypothetical protein ACYDFT_06615 [Thermoplasmata archaeon]